MAAEKYPDDYVPKFTPADIFRRFEFLYDRCKAFLSETERAWPSARFRVDPLIVLNVAQSAMDDIWRFKVFHLGDAEKRSDAVKRAAYFTKWIVRLRPIYYARPWSEDNPSEVLLDKHDPTLGINEGFGIRRGLDTIAKEIGVDHIILDPDFQANLIYDLRYRNFSEDALLAVYGIIRDEAEGIRDGAKDQYTIFKIFPSPKD